MSGRIWWQRWGWDRFDDGCWRRSLCHVICNNYNGQTLLRRHQQVDCCNSFLKLWLRQNESTTILNVAFSNLYKPIGLLTIFQTRQLRCRGIIHIQYPSKLFGLLVKFLYLFSCWLFVFGTSMLQFLILSIHASLSAWLDVWYIACSIWRIIWASDSSPFKSKDIYDNWHCVKMRDTA